MFGIDGPELLVIIIVLIVVVGPKDLPRMMRAFGKAAARMRATAQEFRDHFEDAMREADMGDMADTLRDARKLDPRKKLTQIFEPFRTATHDIAAVSDVSVKPDGAAMPDIEEKQQDQATSPDVLPQPEGTVRAKKQASHTEESDAIALVQEKDTPGQEKTGRKSKGESIKALKEVNEVQDKVGNPVEGDPVAEYDRAAHESSSSAASLSEERGDVAMNRQQKPANLSKPRRTASRKAQADKEKAMAKTDGEGSGL